MSRKNIMEVCGTHTNVIARLGIKEMYKSKINFISGPGCPVCVTDEAYIDTAIDLLNSGVTILGFGDIMKVKGSKNSLIEEKSKSKLVEIIYSPLQVIEKARDNPDKEFVFMGVGFETTAPIIAAIIKNVTELGLKNISFLNSIKVMPPILEKILENKKRDIGGIICPGNVSVIMGENYFRFIYDRYGINAVICGFDFEQITSGINFLISDKGFMNFYTSSVRTNGNETAQKFMRDVFMYGDGNWRGIGEVKKSSLEIKKEYSEMDAYKRYNINQNKIILSNKVNSKCKCGDVVVGNIEPHKCELFGMSCIPINPKGPCMASSEGTCAITYKYTHQGMY